MIIGIGSDLCDVRRIQKSLDRFGDRFVQRVFTDLERSKAERRSTDGPHSPRAATYAKRFAAKEACAKALGTGFRDGVFHKDMGVVNLPSGQPTLKLTGGALERLHRITPEGMVARIHLSMTDELPLAMAYVIIEAVPADLSGPGRPAD